MFELVLYYKPYFRISDKFKGEGLLKTEAPFFMVSAIRPEAPSSPRKLYVKIKT